jgi:GTPase SAR1 family protein
MATIEQPAKKSYWFDKGYKDLKDTVIKAWQLNKTAASDINTKLKTKANIGGVKGWAWRFFYWGSIGAIYVFGSIITAICASVNFIIVAVLMIGVYLGFSVIWTIDRLYLAKNRIFTACHACKEKSLIPAYKCPNCGTVHTKLVPGVYGILNRKCTGDGTSPCGHEIPTAFFNGRSKLSAVCAHCGTPLSDRESRPICIPIVGGRSVGKTAFITAFSYDFINKVAPPCGFEIEDYNPEKVTIYEDMKRAYQTSDFALTPAQNTSGTMSGISSVSFSFFIKNSNLHPDRLVHIYDIAGEFFTGSEEKEVQKQYEYCHGIVLIVDPLAIQSIYDHYENSLSDVDKNRRGEADITSIVDVFINKLREVTGLSDSKMHSVPLAVVISKTDAIPEIDQQLSYSAAELLLQSDTEKFKTVFDAHDYLCRKFFQENDMRHFLTTINLRFKNNRFFSCSPIGHSAMSGAFQPRGVLPVMEWLFKTADTKIGAMWNTTEFSKEPVGLKEIR